MFILFGLGNNEQKYLKTKHNAGRIIVENLAKIWNLEFKKQKNFHFAKYQNTIKTEQKKASNLPIQEMDSVGRLPNSKSLLKLDNFKIKQLDESQNQLQTLLQDKSYKNILNSQTLPISSISLTLQEYFLLYSDGFMNNSGEILRDFCSYYKLGQKNCQIVILQDDSDQFIGNFKLCIGGGTAGHNGIISVYKHFDKEKIWRLKIGIRPIDNKLKSETFVLSRLENIEEENLSKMSSQINQNLAFFQNFAKLQNLVNSF